MPDLQAYPMIYHPLLLVVALLVNHCNTSARDLSDSDTIQVDGGAKASYTLFTTEESKIFCRLPRFGAIFGVNEFDITSPETRALVNSLSANARAKLQASNERESIMVVLDKIENKVSIKEWDFRNINGLGEEDEKKIVALALKCRVTVEKCAEFLDELDEICLGGT